MKNCSTIGEPRDAIIIIIILIHLSTEVLNLATYLWMMNKKLFLTACFQTHDD